MALKRTRHTGKEPAVPASFAPTAGESELVSRIGVYGGSSGEFTSGNTKNVAWAGNSDTFSGAYDGRNILLHYIKVINLDPDNQKEVHFWSNDEDDRDVTGANYLFNIPMAKAGGSSVLASDKDGRIDTVIEFPIPLLVMGGCRIGVKNINSYGAFDYDVKVEICYTVLESTPDTASFEDLKYQYLSAFSTFNASSSPEYAIQPDTASTEWKEDIELWGGMCMNYTNAAGSAALATTYVKNADAVIVATVSCVKGPTNAFDLTYPSGLTWTTGGISGGWPSWSGGSLSPLSLPTLSGSFPTITLPTLDITWSVGYTLSLGAAGSDTTVSFFPYPIYCKGNNSGSNMRVYTNAGTVNYTRGTWFYRPVKAQGVDHGWV